MESDNNNQNNEVNTEPYQEIQLVTEPVQEVQPSSEVVQEPVTEVPVSTPQEPQVQVQMINQEQKKEGKKKLDKNTIIRIVAIAVIVIGILVYFIFFHKWNFKVDNTNPKSVLEGYFNSLNEKDYAKAYSYVYVPDGALVGEDDYLTYVSNNRDVSDKKIATLERLDKNEPLTTFEVVFTDTGKKYKYNLNMLSNGEWKLVLDDLYIEGWKVEVPGGSKLYIDNQQISSNLSKKENEHDIYTLTIAPTNKKFKVETNFETYSTKLDVAGSNSGEKIIPEITKDSIKDDAIEGLKKLWNNLYKDYTNSVSKEEVLKKYFDSNFKLEDMDKYYIKDFDTLTKKGNKNNVFTNIEMESILINPNKKSTIESNDVLKIEFGYKIKFLVDYVYAGSKDLEKSMSRYSSIKLRKTSDGYKISEITDEKLFNFLSYTYVDF